MAKTSIALLLSGALCAGLGALPGAAAQSFPGQGKELPPPPPKKPAPPEKQKPADEAPTCTLLTTDAPRGGRLEVEGRNFGKAPLVRIAGKVTRMIERTETKIAVQIPRDSDGGAVTVKVGPLEVECGTLTIIGKN